MIANAIYDLLPIPTETLIVAGILVGLGLGCLFPDHDNEKNGSIISVVGKTTVEIIELFKCTQKVP